MDKRFIWIYITVFINILGFGMIFPLLPLFAETFKATSFEIGLIAASFSIGQFFTGPLWGRLSDRFGRKPIILSAIIISTISFLILPFAKSLILVYLSRILTGIASGAVFPISQAYVADLTTKDERTTYMGKVAAMFAIGFIFGPVFGGFLGAEGFSLAFYAAAFVSFINLFFVFFLLPESITKKTEKLVLREGFINFKAIYSGLRGDFGILFFLLFAWAYYISNFQITIPLFTQERFGLGPFENGILLSLVGLVAGINQWFFIQKITDKLGEMKAVFVSILIMLTGLIFVTQSQVVLAFTLFFLFSTIGSSFLRPTLAAIISKATHEGQGTTMGLAFSIESLGRFAGPVLAGIAIQSFGIASPFWLTIGVLLLSLFLFWRVELTKRQ